MGSVFLLYFKVMWNQFLDIECLFSEGQNETFSFPFHRRRVLKGFLTFFS